VNKIVASQKVTLLAIDTSTNLPKTGDAANLTAYVSKDDGAVTVLGDTSATELDSTNALGLYSFDLTQGETNANKLVFSGKSSTANIRLIPLLVYTRPANFQATAIDASGIVDADAQQWLGQTIAAVDTNGYPKVTIKDGTGTGEIDTTSGRVQITEAQIDQIVSEQGAASPTVADIADAVWEEVIADHSGTAGSAAAQLVAIDDFLDTEIASILAAVDTEVASILAAVDTEVAAIKAKTDSLTFTVANVLDANIQRINDVAVLGDGGATPWGP
jgi:hypothetical protein